MQELIRSGAFEDSTYFCTVSQQSSATVCDNQVSKHTNLEIIGNLEQRRVCDRYNLDLIGKREIEADTSAIAVSESRELGYALRFESLYDGACDGVRTLSRVLANPRHDVEVDPRVEGVRRGRIAIEEVGHHNLVSVPGKVVSQELNRTCEVDVSHNVHAV